MKSLEDWSIGHWWERHPRQGLLWFEVEVGGAGPGGWSNRRSARRIDAVHMPDHPRRELLVWNGADGFAREIQHRELELVEAKGELNLAVVGQCLGAVDMLSRAYPQHGRLIPTAVVRFDPDERLAWVCGRRAIVTYIAPDDEVRRMRTHG